MAIFCHLLADAQADGRWAAVTGLFDADEHARGFGGVQACFEDPRRRAAAGVLIGYPGNDKIVVGSRGFLRATLRVSGRAAHSGSRQPVEANAVARAARLVVLLDEATPDADDAGDDGRACRGAGPTPSPARVRRAHSHARERSGASGPAAGNLDHRGGARPGQRRLCHGWHHHPACGPPTVGDPQRGDWCRGQSTEKPCATAATARVVFREELLNSGHAGGSHAGMAR